MKLKKGTIRLDNMRFYSYHGAVPQENTVGAWYRVSIEIETDFSQAMESDSLEGTVDYSRVALIAKEQMNIPSRLIEHAAARIACAVMGTFPKVREITVTVVKENPPVCCSCSGSAVSVTLCQE